MLFDSVIALMILLALACMLYPLIQSEKPPFLCGALIACILPVSALYIYMKVGSYEALKNYEHVQQETVDVKAAMAKIKSPEQLIAELQAHLQQDPRRAEGWFLLGKLYAASHQWPEAKSSLWRAHSLMPNNENYLLAYIDADFTINKNQLPMEDVALLAPLLQKDPNNLLILNMLAIDAYMQHHYVTSVSYLERLLTLLPPDSDGSKAVLQLIAKAQKNQTR